MLRPILNDLKAFIVVIAASFTNSHISPHFPFVPDLRLLVAAVLRLLSLVRFGLGTFAPLFRASDSPIAIACLRLLTFFPDRPDFRLPVFRSFIVRATFSCAVRPYFRDPFFLPGLFLTAIFSSAELKFTVFSDHTGTMSPSNYSLVWLG
jgi:hypothetical protein